MVLNEDLIKENLSVKEVIDRIEETYKWYAQGKIIMPSKLTLDMSGLNVPNWMNSMPAYIEPCDTVGIKWVGGFINNPKKGLPYIKAKILINDPQTGLMRALLFGDWISDIRTGAQTAVAAKYLAVEQPKIVTIIGCGVQGFSTLECLLETFEFDEIRLCDLNQQNMKDFAEKLKQITTTPIKTFTENEKGVRDSDIIVTATTADAPLVKNEWVKEGALVSTIGSFQELDEKLVLGCDKIVVDQLGQHYHRGEFVKLFESGKLAKENVHGEITQIMSGKIKGREDNKERIVMSIVGMGCLDISIAAMLYEKLKK